LSGRIGAGEVAEDETLQVDLGKRRVGGRVPVAGEVFRRHEIEDLALGGMRRVDEKGSVEDRQADGKASERRAS
jgi:hypothetical protein